MLYLDTALIVSALSDEIMSPQTRAWLSSQASERLLISDWTITEFSSAMAIKLRTRQLSAEQRADAFAIFHRLTADSLITVPVGSAHFQASARFVDRYELGLRSGDALHLAIASDQGATVVTLDKTMARAGPILGVPTHLLR